ncbi:hypothetical protein GGQ85_003051 [Nitrobacter vulgaris]|nr:hypothetical protein [Nitrobacter vulgaris]
MTRRIVTPPSRCPYLVNPVNRKPLSISDEASGALNEGY